MHVVSAEVFLLTDKIAHKHAAGARRLATGSERKMHVLNPE